MKTTLNDYLCEVLRQSLAKWDVSQRAAWHHRREFIDSGGIRPPSTGDAPKYRKRDQRTREALAAAGMVRLRPCPFTYDGKRITRIFLTVAGAKLAEKAAGLKIPKTLWAVIEADERQDVDALQAMLDDPYQGDDPQAKAVRETHGSNGSTTALNAT